MGTVKTTISIDERLWKNFSILVIEDKGHRKKNDVIEDLIKEYVRKKSKGGRRRWLPLKVVRTRK